MMVMWRVVVAFLSLLAWGGQALSWLSPSTAVRWNVMEAEEDVEPTFWADVRAEAAWDTLTLWIMVVAGVLIIVNGTALLRSRRGRHVSVFRRARDLCQGRHDPSRTADRGAPERETRAGVQRRLGGHGGHHDPGGLGIAPGAEPRLRRNRRQ